LHPLHFVFTHRFVQDYVTLSVSLSTVLTLEEALKVRVLAHNIDKIVFSLRCCTLSGDITIQKYRFFLQVFCRTFENAKI